MTQIIFIGLTALAASILFASVPITAGGQHPTPDNQEKAIRERLNRLDEEYRRLKQQLPRPANDACVRAASSVDFIELRALLGRLHRNILDLGSGLKRSEDLLWVNLLLEVAEILENYATWIYDLGRIAANMESSKGREFSRSILGERGHMLAGQIAPIRNGQINNLLSGVQSPALVAEGRALRDAVQRFADLLKPCIDSRLPR
jgi:hypothetical protein